MGNEAELRGRRAGGAVLLVALGFALYQLWIFIFFFSGLLYEASAAPEQTRGFLRLGSLVVLGGCLAACGLLPSARRLAMGAQGLRLAVVSLVLCLPLSFLVGFENATAMAAALGLVTFSGVGTAVLGLCWCEILAQQGLRKALLVMAVAPALCAVGCVCLTLPVVFWAILLACPIFSALVCGRLSGELTCEPRDADAGPIKAEAEVGRGRAVALFGGSWALIGITYGIMVSVTDKSNIHQAFPWIAVLSAAVSVAIAAVIALRSREESSGAFKTLAPVFTLLLVILAASMAAPFLPRGADTTAFEAIACAGIALVELAGLIMLIIFAQSVALPVASVYGQSFGLRSFGAFLGSAVGYLLVRDPQIASNGILIVALVAFSQVFTAVAFGIALLSSRRESAREKREASEPNGGEEGEERWKSPISVRCEKLAKAYHLTPRETEILVLLAKGRSSEWIQKELVIARGTATAHIHHIYRKLGVHSKQQLLDMVDGGRKE